MKKTLTIAGKEYGTVWLAPMAGMGDAAFRRICKEHGADYMTTAAASLKIAAGSWTIASASLIRSVGNWRMKSGEWKMSMGDEVGYGAGIAPHPNGEREKTSAIFNIEHNRSPRPSGERVRVRGPARTFPLITPPQSPSHQTPPQTLTVVRFPSATHQTGG